MKPSLDSTRAGPHTSEKTSSRGSKILFVEEEANKWWDFPNWQEKQNVEQLELTEREELHCWKTSFKIKDVGWPRA